jgi:hypothetical protein
MAEICQQLAHRNSYNNRHKKIASEWENILRKAIFNGHDVQLHLHPQWLGAEYKNNEWKLDFDKWALHSLPKQDIHKIIAKGKEYLEEILKPADKNYVCRAFRAGNYCITPGEKIIPALKESGIEADSSVTKGMHSEGFYDFREAPSNLFPYITSGNSVNQRGNFDDGIIEFPIFSACLYNSSVLKKFLPSYYYPLIFNAKPDAEEIRWTKERDRIKSERYPAHRRYYKTQMKKNLQFYARAFFSKENIRFDYDYLPASVLYKLICDLIHVLEKKYDRKDIIIPLVMSGHTKDMHSTLNLELLLEKINSNLKHKIVYWSLSEAIEYWKITLVKQTF